MNDESSQSDRRMAESRRTLCADTGNVPGISDDTPEDEYILVMDGIYPVSTCRLHYLDEHTGKIERVATLESYRGKHYGQAGIIEAENWMREKGVTKIYINSRKAALGFYEKLGYTADFSQVSGSGEFECVMTEEELA